MNNAKSMRLGEYEQEVVIWQCARMFSIPAQRVSVFPVVRRNVVRGVTSANMALVSSGPDALDTETEVVDLLPLRAMEGIELTRDGECVLECIVADRHTGLRIGTCFVYASQGRISKIARREAPVALHALN